MKKNSYIIALFLIAPICSLYFEIKNDKEKCYIEEFFKGSVVVIKYHIYGIDTTNQSNIKLLESLQIKLLEEKSNTLISRHIIKNLHGKFTLNLNKDGNYKVCAQNVISSLLKNKKVFMKMKIETESQEEVKINKLIKTEDIDPLIKKIDVAITKAEKILHTQENDFEDESSTYKMQQQYSKEFIAFSIFQTTIVLVIGIYQIYSFRNFLISHKVINKTS